ncbi:MAG: hypothetical protein H8E94_01175, partial [Alphaproteobacteria bacterium]|nr:hypothetical protein [Alphaproteobacteria bacterium]
YGAVSYVDYLLGIILEAHGSGPTGYSAQAYGSAFTVYFVSAVIALVAVMFIKETMPIAPDKTLP